MHNIIFLLNLQQMNNKNKVFLIQEIERIRISKTEDKKKIENIFFRENCKLLAMPILTIMPISQ